MKDKVIKSIRVLNGGEYDLIFVVGEKSDGAKITRITQEDDNVFAVWLENGDDICIISNNVIIHWTNN
jgi:hypothetical protein